MYLLDTVVLSELRKPPRQRNRNLVRWIGEVPSQDLFVSVLTIGEIERGVEQQRRLNPEFAERIAFWLELILRTYERRILAIDVAVARRWGRCLQSAIRCRPCHLCDCARTRSHRCDPKRIRFRTNRRIGLQSFRNANGW